MWHIKNRSDPCGCWCAWYSEEGYGRCTKRTPAKTVIIETIIITIIIS